MEIVNEIDPGTTTWRVYNGNNQMAIQDIEAWIDPREYDLEGYSQLTDEQKIKINKIKQDPIFSKEEKETKIWDIKYDNILHSTWPEGQKPRTGSDGSVQALRFAWTSHSTKSSRETFRWDVCEESWL